jgi:hypothetical protein
MAWCGRRMMVQPGGTTVRFFTCKIGLTGIGDQLSQLGTLYRIGRSFGLTYVHTPFDNLWCPGLDINHFLGLDLGEERIESFKEYRVLDVPYLVVLDHLHRKQPLESLFSEKELEPPVLFRLCSAQEIYSRKPDDHAVGSDTYFDLSAKFSIAHRNVADLNPFKTDKLRVAVHIRRGDVCWIEDDGKILFPYKNKEIPAGLPDKDLQRALPISHYVSVLDDIGSVCPLEQCEIRIYSDGYGNPFWGTLNAKGIVRHIAGLGLRYLRVPSRMTTKVSLLNPRIQGKLRRLRREFSVFQKYGPQAQLRIGQSAPLTQETICAFGWADVIVVARRGAFPDLGLRLNRGQRIIHPGTDAVSAVRDLGKNRSARESPSLV